MLILASLVKESAIILAPLAVLLFLLGGREKQLHWLSTVPVLLATLLVIGLAAPACRGRPVSR